MLSASASITLAKKRRKRSTHFPCPSSRVSGTENPWHNRRTGMDECPRTGREATRAYVLLGCPSPVVARRHESYSRWTDHSVHLCFRTPRARFPRTRLLSHMPVVINTLPVAHTTSWACDLRFDAFPSRGIAPSRHSVGLALLQRYSLRSRAHDRPHVSLSEALLSAFASCGIPTDTPCGWHLLPWRRESTYRVTPFPGPIVRIWPSRSKRRKIYGKHAEGRISSR